MISVVIRAEYGVEALAVTLSALVSGVADGLVGDAIVVARRPDDALARVADAVGATLITSQGDPWAHGARMAKRDWVLCLDDGDVPTEGWIRAVDRFIALSPPTRRFGRLSRRQASWGERWATLIRSPRIRAGDLVRRTLLVEGVRPERPARISAAIERDPVFS